MGSFQEGFTLLKFFKVGLLLILWNAGSAFGQTEKGKTSSENNNWKNASITYNIYENMQLYSYETILDLQIPLSIICNELYKNYSKVCEAIDFEFKEQMEFLTFFKKLHDSIKDYVKQTLCFNSNCEFSKRNAAMYPVREVLRKNDLFSFPTTLLLEPCRPTKFIERMVVGPFAVVNGSNLIQKSATGIECVMDLREDLVAPLKKNPLSQKDWIAALDKYKINRRSCISPAREEESYISCVCEINEEFHKWACKEQDEKAVETVLSVTPELYGYAENYVFEIRWFCKIFEEETDIKFSV